ncbi:hypothetical protein B7494_g7376 [Chlorociboria aeruginascens]|nr:hypothetical protein B7494_g7376 [Chlorociboria aeruginascens]
MYTGHDAETQGDVSPGEEVFDSHMEDGQVRDEIANQSITASQALAADKYYYINTKAKIEMQHKMWSITLDKKLHLAPIAQNPQMALDIGTGTGVWAIEFADTYPSARVIGTDLSLTQPSYTPPNCQFELDDAEDDWVFPMKFDFIHGRTLATCFASPSLIIQKAYSALVPGGYLELQDMCLQTSDDGSIDGTALKAWQDHVAEAVIQTGRVWTNVPNYKRWMEDAGFEDVVEVNYRWPSNQWSDDSKEKLLGAWTQAQIGKGMLESNGGLWTETHELLDRVTMLM